MMPTNRDIDKERKNTVVSLRDRSFSHSGEIIENNERIISSSPRGNQEQCSSYEECSEMPCLQNDGVKIRSHRGCHNRYQQQKQRPRSKSESESARLFHHRDVDFNLPIDKKSGAIHSRKTKNRSNHSQSPIPMAHSAKAHHSRNNGSNISCSSLTYGVLSPKYCYKSRGKMWIRPVLDSLANNVSSSAADSAPSSADYASPSTVSSFDEEGIPFLPCFNGASSLSLRSSSFTSTPISYAAYKYVDRRQSNHRDIFRLPFGQEEMSSNKAMQTSSSSFDEVMKKESRFCQISKSSTTSISAGWSNDSSERNETVTGYFHSQHQCQKKPHQEQNAFHSPRGNRSRTMIAFGANGKPIVSYSPCSR